MMIGSVAAFDARRGHMPLRRKSREDVIKPSEHVRGARILVPETRGPGTNPPVRFFTRAALDGEEIGGWLVFMSLTFSWLADTGGYFFGRFLGKAKLYEAVSPKKTRAESRWRRSSRGCRPRSWTSCGSGGL